ncbi:amino acid transporter [Monoraphidium neglectum]|uniref:Amino acid transporter n=1 Tax=Monoraphidium neglectum TaxID=145388 RepID=A0A0D2M6P7_9CHLO|nr:amino acid transporter [Monoraphidium neglectum]KIY99064.1 amino acid transporter [Monoraphidium neglectum]|eukprot:XP_013898084.1 amino acid transporter [Monoraphidium neglectum]
MSFTQIPQVRSLPRLSWFFALGTAAQLAAIGVVCYEMVAHPYPTPQRALVVWPVGLRAGGGGGVGLDDQLVAGFNIIFAYGGQFAFVELLTSMARPSGFPVAVTACTSIMSVLYFALGAFGYISCGSAASEILVFSFTQGRAARAAGAFVLLQALAQYLINANIWSHNLMVLLSRRTSRGKHHGGARPSDGAALSDVESAPLAAGPGAGPNPSSDGGAAAACSGDHPWGPWLVVTAFVVLYSYGISMTIPFFSTLVGIVSSSTYLLCAYT